MLWLLTKDYDKQNQKLVYNFILYSLVDLKQIFNCKLDRKHLREEEIIDVIFDAADNT